jgi:hypothetical protein
MAVAGHVSPKMLAHYSHVRLEAKRTALDALSRRKPNPGAHKEGYATKYVANGVEAEKQSDEVIEKNGRHVGTRTPDLYRVKSHTSPRSRDTEKTRVTGSGSAEWIDVRNCIFQSTHLLDVAS